MISRDLIPVSIVCFLFVALPARADWRDDYEVADGFRLEVDTQGFKFPTSIAFVQQPGKSPESPLYFVTEIRGRVKVVTQNRSVYTFADHFFDMQPVKELPREEGEIGMAGLCLEAGHGYVFVSYAYQDENGYYRNGLSRFQCEPGAFNIQPRSRTVLLPVLKQYLSAVSHQIGPMAIHGDYLYLCIGDGEVTADSRKLDSPNGKLLRLTLDGLPAPGNPYAVDDNPANIRNYIWARGFRNPFSIKLAGDRIFVCDNGPGVDRFVEVHAGDDMLYDGTNESMAMNPLFLWRQAASPVQMEYDPEAGKRLGFPATWSESFIIALSGSPIDPPGMSDHGTKCVVALGVDVENGRVMRPPQPLLNYRGAGKQLPVGVAFGPDGLYVVPLMPDSEGNSPILRMTYNPEKAHAQVINQLSPLNLVQKYSCMGCHVIDNRGVGHNGPPINRRELGAKLLKRLDSPEYAEQIAQVATLKAEPYSTHAGSRNSVHDAAGIEKARLWIINRLQEPRFDQQVSLMPNLGIKKEEAEILANWLLDSNVVSATYDELRDTTKDLLPKPAKKHLFISFALGIPVGALIAFVVLGFLRKRR